MPVLDYVAVQVVNALFYSSILFLVASGLSLIYGVMRVLNLAHGAFYMVGAYLAYTVVMLWMGGAELSFVLAPLAALLALAAIGAAVERGLIKPLYRRPEEFQLLATFALLLIFDDLVKMVWGPEYKTFTVLAGGKLAVGRFTVPHYFLAVVLLGFGVAALLWLLLSRTLIGKQMRAAAFNQEVAAALGVNTDRVFVSSFALGAALAGLAGAVAAPIVTAYPGMGAEIIVLSFAVIVIGGMGSIVGSLVGSLIVGFARTLMAAVYPVLEITLIYIVMAVVLLVKPTGIFGREG
jgi:branched-chain amino acid transport system permease protein